MVDRLLELSKIEEGYIKAIEGYRRIALSLPALCISLASASLAFEIYYLRELYEPVPGFFIEDTIVLLPMVAGTFLLVAAAFSLDWVIDSMSAVEVRALGKMYSAGHVPDHGTAKGIFFRGTLFSGAYAIFCLCIASLLFLLIAAIPIFIKDQGVYVVARYVVFAAGGYYAMLIALKMMTDTLPRLLWTILVVGFGLFFLGNIVALLVLLKIIGY